MSIDHPYLLVAATLLASPFVFSLAHLCFGNRDQFVEDIGASGESGLWGLLANLFQVNYSYSKYGWYTTSGMRGVVLNIILFTLGSAALVATAYHLLVFVAGWFG